MSELIERCKERLEKNITVWCDWKDDIIELINKAEAAEATLQDSALLHAAMLRGTVPRLSWRQLCHLSGEVYNGEEAQLAEIVRLREELKAAEASGEPEQPVTNAYRRELWQQRMLKNE